MIHNHVFIALIALVAACGPSCGDRVDPTVQSGEPERTSASQASEEEYLPAAELAGEEETLRDEARDVAARNIRDATNVMRIAEAVLRHDPDPDSVAVEQEELETFEQVLTRARAAFDEGDYALAGVLASNIIEGSRPAEFRSTADRRAE